MRPAFQFVIGAALAVFEDNNKNPNVIENIAMKKRANFFFEGTLV